MLQIRPPAVAGLFYPEHPEPLRRQIESLLGAAGPAGGGRPRALVVPHAGYVYSGPIAASAYRLVQGLRGEITRVVLLGPAHRVAFKGVAASAMSHFATPLGQVEIDHDALQASPRLPQLRVFEAAHRDEHSLEVQLPFLQILLGPDFRLLPLLVGDADGKTVLEVVEALWGGPETLILVSSDLSHYHDYRSAQRLDSATSRAIERLDPSAIGAEQACGRNPLRGLLLAARRHGLRATTLDLRNSGDTAGNRDRVVGYGAYAFV